MIILISSDAVELRKHIEADPDINAVDNKPLPVQTFLGAPFNFDSMLKSIPLS